MIQLGLGFGVVTGVVLAARSARARTALRRRPGRAWRRWRRPCSSPRSPSRSPAWSSCSTAILIGAGDGRYLALSGTAVTAAFVPVGLLVASLTSDLGATVGLVWLWVAFCVVFMGGRGVVLATRARHRLDGDRIRGLRGHGSLECGGDLAADRRHGSGDRLPRHPPGRLRLDRRPGRLGPRAARPRRPGAPPNRRGLVVTAWACLAFSVVSWPEGSPATLTPVLGDGSSASPPWPGASWSPTPSRTPSRAVCAGSCWGCATPSCSPRRSRGWSTSPVRTGSPPLPRSSPRREPGSAPRARQRVRSPGLRRARRRVRDTARPAGHAGKAPPPAVPPAPASKPRPKTVGFSAAEAKRKARARREREASKGGSTTARPGDPPRARQRQHEPRHHAARPRGRGARATSTGSTSTSSPSEPPGNQPVTGAEVIEKVRRRRAAREKAQQRDRPDDT